MQLPFVNASSDSVNITCTRNEVTMKNYNQVCKVQIALADSCLDKSGKTIGSVRYLKRPIQKLVLLMPAPGEGLELE